MSVEEYFGWTGNVRCGVLLEGTTLGWCAVVPSIVVMTAWRCAPLVQRLKPEILAFQVAGP